MIEHRFLKPNEFLELMLDAPKTETKYLKSATNGFRVNPYQWITDRAVEKDGLVINNRPIYFGVLTQTTQGRYEVWTVVNTDVKEQFTLYKLSKRTITDWAKKYKTIYANMEKVNPKNIEWAKRIGFKPIEETETEITFLFQGEK